MKNKLRYVLIFLLPFGLVMAAVVFTIIAIINGDRFTFFSLLIGASAYFSTFLLPPVIGYFLEHKYRERLKKTVGGGTCNWFFNSNYLHSFH